MLGKSLIKAAAGNVGGEVIEDLFQTWLYTGNSSTQTITNGIDLAGEGGLVWIKSRSNAAPHSLFDTARGANKSLRSNSTLAEENLTSLGINALTSFSSSGFALGDDTGFGAVNTSPNTYASWTFRKAPGFFDIVTYTGTGVARTVAHSLGSVPGTIIVKRTDLSDNWAVYHTSLGNTKYLELNQTAAAGTDISRWNNTTPTSTVFTVGTDASVNASGGTYVAYLFAHDEQIFGEGGDQSVIKCGSYTGTNANGNFVNLGWEPQFVLIKNASRAADWSIWDNMRGVYSSSTNDAGLFPNTSGAESSSGNLIDFNATGFTLNSGSDLTNWFSGDTFIYIAIRRGPMKTPTSGTEVFKVFNTSVIFNPQEFPTNFAADAVLTKASNQSSAVHFSDKLRGGKFLETNTTNTESSAELYRFSSNTSVLSTAYNVGFGTVQWLSAFRRAPGFFDVVAYNGNTSVAQNVSHSLGVAPELMIFKVRSGGINGWFVYHKDEGVTKYLQLQTTASSTTSANWLNNTAPTSSVFSLGTYEANWQTYPHIAYLFATLPGISKVGSYTGTGTTLNIDCGFTSGSRLVLIKRTDSTGDWYVWDTARGIIAANDPFLLLNSTAAENSSTDYIDPLSSGFQISSTAPAAINANGGSYIFLAIS